MKSLSRTKKIILIIIGVMLVLSVAVFGVINYFFKGLKVNNIDKDNESLGISQSNEQEKEGKQITNIAIFGVDGRNQNVVEGRSDSLMVLSVDKNKSVIKLTSILRDSYVAIEGHGHEKINHAYSYGGAQLAIRTLNQNFNLDIRDYITANFGQFTDVINLVGGIDIEITQREMNEINKMTKSTTDKLTNYGNVHLNGEQALQYSRIRMIDNEIARANRQRKVLQALFTKAKESSMTDNLSLIKATMPLLETSISHMNILGYAQKLLISGTTMEQRYIPDEEDNPIGGIYEGAWVWRYDIPAAAKRLHDFIYG